ncbi:MAG: Smr/MutS family protein [Alphaproteobacteria bacterium]
MARRRLTADERALWAAVTADVRRLRPAGDGPREAPPVAAEAPPEPAPGRQSAGAAAAMRVPTPAATPARAKPPPEPGHGLDRRRHERRRRGQLPIDGVIDLHGLTQAAAHRRIDRYVAESVAAGRRVILVVTGKGPSAEGGGILRRRLADWLMLPACRPHVLAFTPAQPRHGGSGAFYVLLRRKRDDRG